MNLPTRIRSGLSLSAAVAIGCVGTQLEAPADHPGNPQARAGQVAAAQALRPEFDPAASPVPRRAAPPAGSEHEHEHHGHHGTVAEPAGTEAPGGEHADHAPAEPESEPAPASSSAPASHVHETKGSGRAAPPAKKPPAAQVWSCPMHPEVVRNQPGRCPKCGMNLEPKGKAGGGAKP